MNGLYKWILVVIMSLLVVGCIGGRGDKGYSVSGFIKDARENPVSGVALVFEKNGKIDAVIAETDNNGQWRRDGLSGTVVVTPEKPGWKFEPISRIVTDEDTKVDFIAISRDEYDGFGVVEDKEGNGIQDVKLTFWKDSNLLGRARSDEDGKWVKEALIGSVIVVPEKTGYVFEPESVTLNKDAPSADFVAIEVEFDASGFVLDEDGRGINNVNMTFVKNEVAVENTTTDEQGRWNIVGLTGIVTVVPSKEKYRFVPQFQVLAVNAEEIDFVGLTGFSLHVDGEGEVKQEELGPNLIELTANPKDGWRFSAWVVKSYDDDPEDPSRLIEVEEQFEDPTIVVTLDGPVWVKAYFSTGNPCLTGVMELKHTFPVSVVEDTYSGRDDAGLPAVKAAEQGDPFAPEYFEDQLIVRYNNYNYAEQKSQLENAGYIVLDSIKTLKAYLVIPHPGVKTIELEQLSGVTSFERNGIVRLDSSPVVIPNDELFYAQWHYNQIRLPQTWAVTQGDHKIRVAVVDTGIDPTHPDLMGQLELDHAVDFTADGEVTDRHGHGTHVAGTIGALSNNEVLVAGVMWDVTILPVKIFDASGSSTTWTVVKGLLYAASLEQGFNGERNPKPVDIINLSLGGPYSRLAEDAVVEVANTGVIMVAAAGNDARPMVGYPAAFPEVIAVGAVGKVDKNDKDGLTEPPLASYSNWGPEVDVVAPGGGLRIGFDYVWSTYPTYLNPLGYAGLIGTSMATPHVAGVIGLMLANGIDKNDVREILHRTSMEINMPTPNVFFGHGLINAYWAVNAVEEMNILVGLREGDRVIATKAETRVPAKGGSFRIEDLAIGEYQFIAWVDVNKNGLIDAGDYYAETPKLSITLDSNWLWMGELAEVGVDGVDANVSMHLFHPVSDSTL